MTWTVVRGRYKRGTIELLERMPAPKGTEVLILLPERPRPYKKGGVWQHMRVRQENSSVP